MMAGDFTEEPTVPMSPEMERELRAERLAAIRARIRRSLEDPSPDLSLEEVDAELDALFAKAYEAEAAAKASG
jgi:antitoxin ParD1/3/4